MKEKKNPMSCFDDDIGDDFLSAWKPSKMNSVPNLDFECSQVTAPEKTFKLPESFDLDMDFGTGLGLNSKLSSFDIDLDFLKSPKHGDSAKGNCGGALMSHSQTSSDALQAGSGHVASSLPGREREDVVSKNRHAEEHSATDSHDQVDAKVISKAGDSGETLTRGSQKEMAKMRPVDFNDKRVLKFDQETSNDEIKGTARDRSFSKSFEGAPSTQGCHTATELLDTARERNEQPREDVTEGAPTRSADQGQILLPAQAVSKENNTVVGEILNDKNTEDVSPKRIETETEGRSFQGTLQGVTTEQSLGLQSFVEELAPKHNIETKTERRNVGGTFHGATKEQSLKFKSVAEDATPKHVETKTERRRFRGTLDGVTKEQTSFELQSVAEVATPKHIKTKAERKSFRGTLEGVTKEESSLELQSVAEEATPKLIETKAERRSFRGTVQGVAKVQSLELQSVGLVKSVAKQTASQPPCQTILERSSGTVTKIQDDKEQTGQTDFDPLTDIAAHQVIQTSAAEHSQELKTPSMLTKVLKKVDVLNSSSSQLGGKLKSTAPKHRLLSKAFMGLKPKQVSALRTSRSHALQPLRFDKQIAAPSSKADDEELQSNLKAQVNVETRSSLQTSGASLTRTTLGKKRGPPAIKEPTGLTKASADLPERSDNEAPEKRPKLQAAHRITEQESYQSKLLNESGQGNIIQMPIPAIEKLSISIQIPQGVSRGQSRPLSSLRRLTSLTRLQQKDLGSSSAARIDVPRSEDIFVGTNSFCVQSSVSHGQAVDPVTAEIIKKKASGTNHKLESNYHSLKQPKDLVSRALPKGSNFLPLKDSRGGFADSEMHEEAECNKVNVEVSCPQLLLDDIMQDQARAKEISRDSKNICKTTAYYSVELDKIMSMLKQKQRRANDLLAKTMAHNAKMKYLLDSKNQEKISILQKSIAERLEDVKLQAEENRAKRCEWCEEHREDEAAVLIKEHCNNVQ